jgi:hypothetical protein
MCNRMILSCLLSCPLNYICSCFHFTYTYSFLSGSTYSCKHVMCTSKLTKNYTYSKELLCFNLEAKTKYQSIAKDVLEKCNVYTCILPSPHPYFCYYDVLSQCYNG